MSIVPDNDYPKVAGAAVLADRVLRVLFRDGLCGDVLLTDDTLVGRLEPLREVAYFARVQVDHDAGTLIWPDGEQIGAVDLYDQAENGQLL